MSQPVYAVYHPCPSCHQENCVAYPDRPDVEARYEYRCPKCNVIVEMAGTVQMFALNTEDFVEAVKIG